MITSALISHYKSISEANLKFGAVNVIVGPNGSGKSNLLDALYFLHDCVSDDIDTAVTKRHGIDSIRQWSRTRPFNIILDVNFKNRSGEGNYRVVISSNKGNYRIIEELGSWYGIDPRHAIRGRASDTAPRYQANFKRNEKGEIEVNSNLKDFKLPSKPSVDEDQLFLTTLTGRVYSDLYIQFMWIAREFSSFSKYNIYPNTLRQPQLISREAILSEDGGNLSSVLKRINSNKRFSAAKDDILAGLRIIMPIATDFQVKSAGGYYVPVLRVSEQNGDLHDFNLSQISDGTLRTLGLLAAFYQPSGPSKIGVEEPEQMIHPGALSVLHEAIESFVSVESDELRQVFVTTHSPTLIDLFDPKAIIWARLNKGVTEAGHVGGRQLEIIKEQLFTAGELLLTEGFF